MKPEISQRDAQQLASAYTKTQHRVNQVGVVAHVALCTYGVWRYLDATAPEHYWWLALAGVLGIAASDVFTGFIHWGCDTWGNADTFFWGRVFIRSFREHHVDQRAITRHDWAQCNGEACWVGILLSTPLLVFMPSDGMNGWLFGSALLFSMLLFSAAANQFHKWAHQKDTHPIVAFLQRTGILMSFQHHAAHHRAPFSKGYCITVGWMNPILDRIQFWRFLEKVIMSTKGALPREDDVGADAALHILDELGVKPAPKVLQRLNQRTGSKPA